MPMISESTPVAFSDPLPEAVDVVVIGAGVVGTSTAWFLARRGASVALCEKGRIAGEQSSRNWGWVRQQGRDRDELPIMMESNRIWRGLAAETGEKDLAFTASGCLYLAEEEADLARFGEWHHLAKEHRLDTPHAFGGGGARSGSRHRGQMGRRIGDSERRARGALRRGARARPRGAPARGLDHGRLCGPHRRNGRRADQRRVHRARGR